MARGRRGGGRRWTTEGSGLPGTGRIEHLVATSTLRAWAVVGANRLMSTTDGGTTWVPEAPRGQVLALAQRGRALWMIGCLGGSAYNCPSVLLRKALPNVVWTIASPKLAPNPPPALAFAGGGRVVISAAGSLVIVTGRGRRFTERPDPIWMGQPCQPAGLAAAGRSWRLLCLFESGDGGARWVRVPGPNPQGSPASFDVLSPTYAWLLAVGRGLWRTTDGRHWRAL